MSQEELIISLEEEQEDSEILVFRFSLSRWMIV